MTVTDPALIPTHSPPDADAGGGVPGTEAAEGMLDETETLLERHGLLLALLAAWIAMLGSLYFSEVRGYAPCPLCWYQRIFMYPLAVILAVGLARRDAGLPLYTVPLAGLGWLIASYHLLIERGIVQQSSACKIGVSCTVRYINWFGFVTIPLLAWTAFLIILLGSSAVYRSGSMAAAAGDASGMGRWKPVLAVVGPVLLVFALLWQLRW